MSKIDKIITIILLTIAETLSRYSNKYYSHEISNIENMIKDDKNGCS